MRYRLAAFLLLLTATAFSQPITDQPAFSSTPADLQKAFDAIPAGDHPVTVLLDESRYEFETPDRYTQRLRLIFKTWTKAGAEGWAMAERSWAPWEEDRPIVRARVISRDGTAHELDPATIAESAVRQNDNDVLTDRRMLKIPLPAVEAGSVVEMETIRHRTRVALEAGGVYSFQFGFGVPVEHTRVIVRGPASIPFRHKAQLLPDLAIRDTTAQEIREMSFDQGPMKPVEDAAPFLPPDAARYPRVMFSTGKDWNTIAAGYSAIVEKQIKGFNAAPHLPKFAAGAGREAKILSIVDKLNREIRYTGIEFAQSTIVPNDPADVIKRKYGDCKDKSALAVALLRAAGIPANVALLFSSTGEDIEPTLPGVTAFNHAIVYVPGSPALWLDPTDPDLRLHVVSPSNQDRHALLVSPQTTDLIQTPTLSAEENRLIETREFTLAELGKAKIVETSETHGTVDRLYRGQFSDVEEKALRDSLKSYVERSYGESKIAKVQAGDGNDLGHPMTLRIELEDAQRGFTARTESAVGVFLSHIGERLPDFFRVEEEKKKERRQDFVIEEPFTDEWRYKVTAPSGFKLRQLPPAKEEKLGPATLDSRFTRESDTAISMTFRFVMPKRRFTAAEGAALRTAMMELSKRSPLLIFFDQVGETFLAAGKVKEALAEFGSLRKQHPTEALHALQTARALLAAGAGESARAEARRATAMEPKDATAQLQLAEILKHDLIGRPLEKGYDRDGAVAAYRKALELNPEDHETRANLAILLEHDTNAVRYGNGAKVDEAIAEYKQVLDKLAGLRLPQNYPVALLRAGRTQELHDYLGKQPSNEFNQLALICTEALLNGSKAALARAGEISGVTEKQKALANAGQTLLVLRQYELAADMFQASGAGAPNPAAVSNLVQILRKTRRADYDAAVINEPEDAIRVFLIRIATLERHEKDWAMPFSSLFLGSAVPPLKGIQRAIGMGMSKVKASGFTVETALDLMFATTQFSKEGDDRSGYVVRANFAGNGAPNLTFFVNREAPGYRIIAMTGDFAGAARLALDLAGKGRTDEARAWLDRARQELKNSGGDDPLDGSLFAKLWVRGQAADTAAVQRAAAALLATDAKTTPAVIPILEEARRTSDASLTQAISAALSIAYYTSGAHEKAIAVAEELMKSQPQSARALILALAPAYASGKRAETDRIFTANLDRFKQDTAALRGVAALALQYGDSDRTFALTNLIILAGRAEAADYNQLAWSDVVAGRVTAATLEAANKGILMGGGESPAMLHTQAAIAAELGKENDARAGLLQRLKLSGADEPDDDEWYVFGRIAEHYGLPDEAARMYRAISKPADESHIPSSSYALAQRRLKTMGR